MLKAKLLGLDWILYICWVSMNGLHSDCHTGKSINSSLSKGVLAWIGNSKTSRNKRKKNSKRKRAQSLKQWTQNLTIYCLLSPIGKF
jgi:hypothetical protein